MSGVPANTTVQEYYFDHLKFDSIAAGVAGPGFRPGVNPSMDFMENLYGRRSGIGVTTPWSTPIRTGASPAPYTDTGSGGTVTYAAGPPATATDTSKAWAVNEWINRTCFALNTTAAITKFKIASNTATVLSAAAAVGWSNGTPAAGALYWVAPDAYPNTQTGQSAGAAFFADNWWAELRQTPGNPAGE